jgi:hypothetical protein
MNYTVDTTVPNYCTFMDLSGLFPAAMMIGHAGRPKPVIARWGE